MFSKKLDDLGDPAAEISTADFSLDLKSPVGRTDSQAKTIVLSIACRDRLSNLDKKISRGAIIEYRFPASGLCAL